MFEWAANDDDKPWKRWALAGFALFVIVGLVLKWNAIQGLALSDTDDNLRLAQVRDWLAGQGWYDLRQYRMEPPEGANIHWSRIPDLPIAGLILLLSPLLGSGVAEQVAVTVAPLIPALILIFAIAVVTRRLVAKGAWPIALIAVLMASSVSAQLMPLRIDHHGWQLAMLALVMAGFTDPRPARGGAIMGLAIACSLAIGLEMIIFIALMGAASVIGWIFFIGERQRLIALGAATAGGCALFYLLFASEANRQMVCDALSPVWLADALVGGALLVAIAWKAPRDWRWRLGLAAGAGLLIAAFHALAFPDCLTRLEGVSDEADRLWLSRVTEAKPISSQSAKMMTTALFLPVVALVGYALLWRRGGAQRRRMALGMGVAMLVAVALMFWQTRLASAAQLLAVPGAAGLLVVLLPWLEKSTSPLVRVVGISFAFVAATGALPILLGDYLPGGDDKKAEGEKPKNALAGLTRQHCGTREAMAPLAALPKGHVYTFIDMAPRVLVMTHHTTVTGPYHRNHAAIVENIETLRAPPEEARARMTTAGADYLLVCKGQAGPMGKGVNRQGIAWQLIEGERFDWLEPVATADDNPNLLFRLVPGSSG